MSMNGISNTFIPNTLSGLETLNANNITINGVDISAIYVPFINSPSDVDLANKNLTTSGRIQTTVLKLPSMTYSTTKVLRVKADKEVESVDLIDTFLPYTGAVSSLDMGSLHIYTTATPSSIYDVVNKTYTDASFPTFTFLSFNYLTQIDALNTYLTLIDASNIYLRQTVAASTYLTMANAGATYLTLIDASNIYLRQTVAASTYLTMANAGAFYLTIANASSMYATISNLNLKANIISPTFTGTVTLPSVNFTSTPSSGSGMLLAINGAGNLITTTSTVNQTATSTSATYYLTFVSSSATGAFNPLVFSQIMCNPNVGLIEVNNIKVTSRNQGGSQVSLLARDSDGHVIDGTVIITQTASSANTDFPICFIQYSGTGAFVPLNETSGAFTFNPSTLNLKTSKLQITSVPTGTQQYLLAVDSTGNVIRGTAPPLQQTRTLVNTDYYIPFVSSFVTGDFLPLIENRVKLNPSTGTISMFNLVLTGNANLASLTFNTLPTTGTVSSYLAIDSTGVVIRTTASSSAPTDITPTPINTNTPIYPVFLTSTAGGASTTYVESDGSLFYNSSTNRLTVPIVNASSVVETSAIQNSSGEIININAQGGAAITGNKINLQIQSTTYYWFDKDAFYLTQPVNNVISSILNDLYILVPSAKIISLNNWVTINNAGLIMTGTLSVFTQNIETQATTDLNINVPTSANNINFKIVGTTRMAITVNGGWLPPDGSSSIYIRDAYTTATTTYGRYFGVSGTIYQDFYNAFQWRRDAGLTGTATVQIMSLDNNGLTLQNATSIGQPQLVFAGSGVPTIRIIGNGMNWYMNNTTSMGYFDTGGFSNGGGVAGTGWRINGNEGLTLKSGRGIYLQQGFGAVNATINSIVTHSGTGLSKWGSNGWFSFGGASVCSYDPVGNTVNGIGMGVSYDNNYCYISMVKPGNYWSQGIIETGHANWYVNGSLAAYITGGGWTNVSDERCKCDINDLSTKKSLQRVLKCKPKYYKRLMPESEGTMPIQNKEEDINRIHIGLLAQEVNEFNPHCVSTWKDGDDEHEKLGIQYNDFVIHLIGAVQEQHAQLQAQQTKIEEQSQAINTLTDSMKLLSEHLAKLTTAFNEVVKEK